MCRRSPVMISAGTRGSARARCLAMIRSRAPRKGLDHRLDPGSEPLDGLGVSVDQGQVHPGQERVMLTEPAGEGLSQGWDLGPHPALRQLGELTRVALARDKRIQHQPA